MAKDTKRPVTRKDLDEMGQQLGDAILAGIDQLLIKINARFDKVEAGQLELKRQLGDLQYDTPTRKAFADLKARVDRQHPPS